jgi:DNA-binding transcriptional regulator YbjK
MRKKRVFAELVVVFEVLLNDTVCSENINDTVKRVAMKIISIVV